MLNALDSGPGPKSCLDSWGQGRSLPLPRPGSPGGVYSGGGSGGGLETDGTRMTCSKGWRVLESRALWKGGFALCLSGNV